MQTPIDTVGSTLASVTPLSKAPAKVVAAGGVRSGMGSHSPSANGSGGAAEGVRRRRGTAMPREEGRGIAREIREDGND
jgi:hypothetical protein